MARIILRAIMGLMLVCALYAASLIGATYQSFESGRDISRSSQQKIVAILPDSSDSNSEAIEAEASAAGKQYGAYVEFYVTATRDEQLQVLDIAAESGADGILLYPVEREGYGDALAACQSLDIPVVVISQRLEEGPFNTFIGSTVSSQRMAVLSCVSGTGGGRILVVDRLRSEDRLYMEAALLEPSRETAAELPPLETRISDLVSVPFDNYSVQAVTILDDTQSSAYSLHTEVFKLLESYRADAVFSYDEDVTTVIAACLESADTLPDIYAVGYGSLDECADYVRAGTLSGVVQQNDAYAASLAVRYLVELGKGSIMPSDVDSGIILVTANNLERVLSGDEM